MAIKWLCTGKSLYTYEYSIDGEVEISAVESVDYKAEIAEDFGEDYPNELWETKPVLTQAGIEAFIGLIPYAQGFTILFDHRLSDVTATGVVKLGENVLSATALEQTVVGSYLIVADDGDSPVT